MKFRVKTFLFVEADSERAAEAVADGFAEEINTYSASAKMQVRRGSAKLVPEREMEESR